MTDNYDTLSEIAGAVQQPPKTMVNADGTINYVDFTSDPSGITAALTRQQYQDYMSRFAPIENRLLGMMSYDNPEAVNMEVQSAIGQGGYVQSALNRNQGQQRYAFNKLGVDQTAQAKQAMDTSNNLNRSTAVVDAANRIRQKIADRNQMISVGAVPNAGRAYGLKTEGGA